ncbi:YnbE family lipoprotein [Amphritea sp. 2_MG-2023]|nr:MULTISPECIES: YnbE family lipoprotein [Amphritea]MBU2967343.1 YnbE family lipoprotein [Amphritea atlantica]MDO6418402.1 YnbE family lipoprotein [Amphritea sp. 2_MG-2023]MDX2422560.1 YnbE family lipoprotein [Amphritea sp.]
MPKILQSLVFSSLMAMVVACTPTVQVAVPNEPITINLNVKIKHEILIKVDKEIDNLFEENSELF